jgi:hypothetical protein
VKKLGLFLALALAACGGSGSATGPEVRAKTVTVLTGDAQSAPTGTTLPIPLTVLVVDAGDVPLVGALVGWKVVSGSASLAAPSSKTDSTGTATMIVTLGNTIGPVAVRGTAGTAPAVTFNLSAVDPCTYFVSYTVGATVNGALTTGDCHQIISGSGYYYDYYDVTVGSQQGLSATMSSTSFDTYLELYGGPDTANIDFIGFNDDLSGTSTNSFVRAIVAPGVYRLAANSSHPNALGSYTLTSAVRPQTISGCQVLWVTRGITVDDSVTSNDCKSDFEGNATFGDAVGIFLRAGSVVSISQHSTAINAQLKLYRGDSLGSIPPVATNDDSAATTTDAFISYAVPKSNTFVIFIGSSVPSQTGAYTLSISSSTTALGSKARPELLRFPPMPSHWPLPAARRN